MHLSIDLKGCCATLSAVLHFLSISGLNPNDNGFSEYRPGAAG